MQRNHQGLYEYITFWSIRPSPGRITFKYLGYPSFTTCFLAVYGIVNIIFLLDFNSETVHLPRCCYVCIVKMFFKSQARAAALQE